MAKMKLGSIMTNVRKASASGSGSGRKDSLSLESSKSTPTSTSSVSGIVSSAASRKISEKDKDKKKSGSGLSKFKTGFFGSKGRKKIEKEAEIVATGKELKQRLFFREKKELSDEEILQAIGEEDAQKVLAQSMDEIANAATFMKKFLDGKKPPSSAASCNSRSVRYVGSLKARLSKTGEELSPEVIRRNPVMSTTVFLGKMISRKAGL